MSGNRRPQSDPMSQSKDYIDFATVLASAVHDMKNSLLLLSQTIEQLSDIVPKDNQQAVDHLGISSLRGCKTQYRLSSTAFSVSG